MRVVACPHCGNHRIVTTKVPKDVVVVLPCPSCHELVVLFRDKVIALNRAIIEKGSREERKSHIAEIIDEFIEPGMFSDATAEGAGGDEGASLPEGVEASSEEVDSQEESTTQISEAELDQFVKVELPRLNDPAYFRKHFG